MIDIKSTQDLKWVVESLATAVVSRFMAHEHASAIWKSIIRQSGIDVVSEQKVLKIGTLHEREVNKYVS